MKKYIFIIFIFALLFQSAFVFASGENASTLAAYKAYYASYMKKPTAALKSKIAELETSAKPLLIAECMQKSGLDEQSKDMGALAKAMGPAVTGGSSDEMSPEAKNRIEEMAEKIFEPTILLKDIRAYISKNYSAASLIKYINWLDSPTGVKMTQLEIASGRKPEIMAEYIKNFKEESLTAERTSLINELNTAINRDSIQSKISGSVVKEILLGFNETAAASRQVSAEKIEAMETATKKNMEKMSDMKLSLAMHSFVYAKATDAELRQYITILNSPEGIWSLKVIGNALNYSIKTASRRYGKVMGKEATERSLRVPGWKEYVFKEENCRVMLPAEPAFEEKDIATDAGNKHLYIRTATTDTAYYSVATSLNYIKEEPDDETLERILTGAAEGSAQKNEIISAEYINAGGYPGIDVVFTGKGARTYNRIILAGLDFYQVIYVCLESDTSTDQRNTFVNSFVIDK